MQSFPGSDEPALDASSLPDVDDVRAAISGPAISDASLREMLSRLAVQLQVDDRDLRSFARDGEADADRPALVARLVLELADAVAHRVRLCNRGAHARASVVVVEESRGERCPALGGSCWRDQQPSDDENMRKP